MARQKRKDSTIYWLVSIFSLVCVLMFVFWVWYIGRYEGVLLSPNTISDFGQKQYFAINHESILLDLDRGEIEVFTPISVTPDIPVFEGSVEWNQPNYIAIATTLYEFTGKEISDDWNLYYIRFITACYDNLNGFDFGEIAYFKSIRNDSLQKDYTVRAYQIIPQYGYIVMASGASFPQPLLDRWESANLQESNINAEDVLRIAEDYGSLAARTSVQNNCKIHTRLTGYSGWELRIYANETGHEIFAIGIDPTTGKILFP